MKIETLPSGNKRTRVSYTDAEGKRRFKSFTAKTTKELKVMVAEYTLSNVADSPTTLLEAFYGYLNTKGNIISPTTKRNVQRTLECFKDISHYKLTKINDLVIQKEINKLSLKYSYSSVKLFIGTLNSVLNLYLPYQRRKLTLPHKIKEEKEIPSDEDVRKLLDLTKGNAIHIVILFASHLGLRRNEISALTYSDIDFKNKTLTINKAHVLDEDRNLIIKAPKSFDGYRTLNIDEETWKEINRRLEAELPLIEVHDSNITNIVKYYWKKLGLNYNVHSLRHYYASVMLKLGIPNYYAKNLMGHSSTSMLEQVYQHIMQDKKNEVNKQITDYFSK